MQYDNVIGSSNIKYINKLRLTDYNKNDGRVGNNNRDVNGVKMGNSIAGKYLENQHGEGRKIKNKSLKKGFSLEKCLKKSNNLSIVDLLHDQLFGVWEILSQVFVIVN